MAKTDPKTVGRILTKALRHRPELLGIQVDAGGYCPISQLVKALRAHGYPVTEEEVLEIGKAQERLGLSPDGHRLRADYGSSIGLRLENQYKVGAEPPELLYHGTALEFLDSIRSGGILRHGAKGHPPRDHVFLTERPEVALRKGHRHGRPIALPVRAAALHRTGGLCYHAKNDIWLTYEVPAEYIDFTGILF